MSWKILTKIWCQTIWGSEKFRATKNQNIFQLQSQPQKETVEFAAAAATSFEDRSKANKHAIKPWPLLIKTRDKENKVLGKNCDFKTTDPAISNKI